jgi:hypothetical protein
METWAWEYTDNTQDDDWLAAKVESDVVSQGGFKTEAEAMAAMPTEPVQSHGRWQRWHSGRRVYKEPR